MIGSHLRTALVAAVCVLVFLFSAFLGLLNDYVGYVILTVAVIVAFYDAGKSSLGTVIVFSATTLFIIPYLALISIGEQVFTAWFALFILVAQAMMAYGDRKANGDTPVLPARAAGLPLTNVLFIIGLLGGGLLLTNESGIAQIAFGLGWSIGLVYLERLHAGTTSLAARGIGLLAFVGVLLIYAIFLWTGFGRIIIAGLFLGPLLIAMHYKLVRVNALALVAVAATLPFVGRVLRTGWSSGLAGVADDSGATHILMTSMLWESRAFVVSPGTIWEQWLLLFLNWVPREVWFDKPLGINLIFVDMYLSREGVSLEHSTALGYFGEHIFYLSGFWALSAVALTAVIIWMRRIIRRLTAPYVSAVVAYDVQLITLFWGGMASFGARVWFAVLPIIAFILLRRWAGLDRPAAAGGAAPPGVANPQRTQDPKLRTPPHR
jgi:hypothetical protein